MKVFGILGLLVAVMAVSYLGVKQLTQNASSNPKEPINQAELVKEETDLASLNTKLTAYFISNQSYPQSLEELDPNYSDYSYQYCSEQKVLVKSPSGKISAFEKGSKGNFETC